MKCLQLETAYIGIEMPKINRSPQFLFEKFLVDLEVDTAISIYQGWLMVYAKSLD